MRNKTFDAFISHSSSDAERAVAIKKHLESAGIDCWKAPDDILPGESWPEAILRAIGDSATMILVWSAQSKASSDVSKELTLAMRHKVSVVPFRIENVTASIEWEYHLANTQWMDAYEGDMESHHRLLAAHIRKLVSGSSNEKKYESEKATKQEGSRTVTVLGGDIATGASEYTVVASEKNGKKENFSKHQKSNPKPRLFQRLSRMFKRTPSASEPENNSRIPAADTLTEQITEMIWWAYRHGEPKPLDIKGIQVAIQDAGLPAETLDVIKGNFKRNKSEFLQAIGVAIEDGIIELTEGNGLEGVRKDCCISKKEAETLLREKIGAINVQGADELKYEWIRKAGEEEGQAALSDEGVNERSHAAVSSGEGASDRFLRLQRRARDRVLDGLREVFLRRH